MLSGRTMELKKNLAAFLVHDFETESKRKMQESTTQIHNTLVPLDAEDNRKFSSAATTERVLQDYNQAVQMEAVIVEDLIKPLIFMFKYFIPFHDTIRYDPVARCCVVKKGSLIRKLFCVIWQLLVLFRFGIKAIPSLNLNSEEDEAPKSGNGINMSALAKGAYFIFITFSCVVFYLFWLKTGRVCVIFNHVITLADKLHLQHRSPSRIKAVKVAVHSSWVFVCLYVFITVILYGIEMLTKVEKNEEASQQALTNSSTQRKGVKYQLDFTEIHVSEDFIIVQIITAVSSFMSIFSWMLVFLHLGAFGLLFRQLIAIFYWRIRTTEELGKYIVIPHEIRTFNKIGWIIDEFNQTYGLSCLLGAVVCVTYISPSIKHAFSGLSSFPQIGSGFHLMFSYLPMIVTTLMIAEIHRMAGSFAGIIKNEFGRFTKECGDPAESLCGMAIVHYDLATSNIGFKGLGFFTVSYQFITTIVSVIISYSILVVQLFPHDNSDIEV